MGLFVAAFALASSTGLAVLLQGKRKLTKRSIVGSMLYNGLLGFAVCAVVEHWQPSAVWLPLGVSVLVGLCGLSASEVVILTWKRLPQIISAFDDNGKKP